MFLELFGLIAPFLILAGLAVVQIVFGSLLAGAYEQKNWALVFCFVCVILLFGIFMGAALEKFFL